MAEVTGKTTTLLIERAGPSLQAAGGHLLRYGLVVILLWFGAFKFTATEAKAIEPLIANSPLMSWLYAATDTQGASRLIGATELLAAGLIALRPFQPRLSALGSIAATGIFLGTLSFLFTTPGVWQWVEGFPITSEVGSFLVKDLFLLGAACWTAGEALTVGRKKPARE